MHRGIGLCIAPNELVLFVDIDVILIAVMILPMRDCPPGVGIFLPTFGRMHLPFGGRRNGFDARVLVRGIALLQDGHERGINELASSRLEPTGSQRGVESFKQNVEHARLG